MTNQLGKHLFTFAVIADSHVNQEETENRRIEKISKSYQIKNKIKKNQQVQILSSHETLILTFPG